MAWAWLVPLLPLLAYGLQVFFARGGKLLTYLTIALLGASFLLSLGVLRDALQGVEMAWSWPWLTVGPYTVEMGLRVGPLEAAMMAMVTFVSFMVEVYSVGYMAEDAKWSRFFANVHLFVAGMLMVVMADNFLLFFAGWEIMGLCSYLLIGHWYEDLSNARAASKSFLVTRLGDIGFLIGIFVLFAHTGTLNFQAVNEAAAAWPPALATLVALLLFLGAAGKSAQFPLHVWLPDAMAGPTPVSALIHAATMVAAGVFLVARTYPIFVASGTALWVVALIGGLTAFMAATIATVQTDIKKTLAYSTISQLGYMMLSLGLFGYGAALFHLLAHAFFKALLFLGSGSVIHGLQGEQDMHRMGGLWRKMPWTALTFILGGAALAGIPPLAGYFSKEAILHDASAVSPGLTWLGIATAGITAYYVTRMIWLTFFGRPRQKELYDHAHESSWVMLLPLILLAVPTVLFGWLEEPLLAFLQAPLAPGAAGYVTLATLSVTAGGVLAGLVLYASDPLVRRQLLSALRPLYVFLKEKWYWDYLTVAFTGLGLALGWLAAVVDRYVIDGVVNGLAWLSGQLGQLSRRWATGDGQAYILAMALALLAGLALYLGMGS
ncbi:MAG: NADH-quinone oxidoreductase subunit L [Clostridiales bacterium]|nr:NADH-quinone oxidoreductase subunit L [Clostridiales bacterium]